MTRRPIACACFDLGGVVVRICRSFEEAALAAGVPLRPVPADEAIVRQRHDLSLRHQRGEFDAPTFHRLMSGTFAGAYSPAEIARVSAAVLREEYTGVAELIRALGAAGLMTACLSNTNDEHWERLVELPALRALHHRHASHLWSLAKPDPAIFRRFEAERGVAGQAIVYFDDLAENVEAARAAGWDAILVDHTGDTAAAMRAALAERGIVLTASAC